MASGRLLKTINSNYGNDNYDWKGVKRMVHAGARKPSGAAHGRANQRACAAAAHSWACGRAKGRWDGKQLGHRWPGMSGKAAERHGDVWEN
jgi:hypothetical protein